MTHRLSRLFQVCSLALLLLVMPGLARAPADPQVPLPSNTAAVRKELDALYAAWGKARVALDREVLERTLAPEFHVMLAKENLTRQQFLDQISKRMEGVRLVRFETRLLTIEPSGAAWVAVMTEKLEVERTGADGKTERNSSLWVTRDGCRKEGDRFLVTYSEAIGHESWRGGEKPPFADW